MEKSISKLLKDYESTLIPEKQITVWNKGLSITFDSTGMDKFDIEERIEDLDELLKNEHKILKKIQNP